MDTKMDKAVRIAWRIVIYALVFGVTVRVWLGAIQLARRGYSVLPPHPFDPNTQPLDLAAILFGASSVALFILSLLIAFVGLIGWGAIKTMMREAVVAETSQRLTTIENEVRGRSFSVLGYIMGEISVKDDLSAPSNKDRLREALQYCEQSYNLLKGTGLPAEFMTLNNLLSYACVLKETRQSDHWLAEANRLKEAAQGHGSPSNIMLTYVRTVLEFSNNAEEIKAACGILNNIASNPRNVLDTKQKREASYLVSLCQSRQARRP